MPNWLRFNAATRTFSGTPSNTNVGILSLKLTATTASGAAVSDTFNLSIANTNDAPIAVNDALTTRKNTPLRITPANLLGNDRELDLGDVLRITATSRPTQGSLVTNNDGSYSYSPNANYQGADRFTYTITDRAGSSSTATVNLTVAPNGTSPTPTTILGLPGNDRLSGNSQNNTIVGLAGQDTLRGFAGNDRLEGGDGNDRLNGGTGRDRLRGGNGNDLYIVDNARDTTTEAINSGIDRVRSSVAWTLGNHLEHLTLTGSKAINGTGNSLNNRLTGNRAANLLSSGAGRDILRGGAGNDNLLGGTGRDALRGGTGDDLLVGGADRDSLRGGAGRDRFELTETRSGKFDQIIDFRGGEDKILVSQAEFGLTQAVGALDAAAFSLGSSATQADDRFIYNRRTGDLCFDPDGVGGATQVKIANLNNRAALDSSHITTIA